MAYSVRRIGTETRINTSVEGSQYVSEYTQLTDGRILATWRGNGTLPGQQDDQGIFQQLFDANMNRIGGEVRINTTVAGSQNIASTIALPGGKWAHLWYGQQPSNSAVPGLLMQIFDENGRVGGETLVNNPVNQVYGATTQKLADGGFVAMWYGPSTQPGQEANTDIFYQRFDAAGAKIGTEGRINTSTEGAQERLVVLDLPGGTFGVVWKGNGTQPGQEDDNGLYLQRFDANWNRLGSETLINAPAASSTEYSSFTNLADGGWVVTYYTYAGSTYEAWQQAFDADGSKQGGPTELTPDAGIAFLPSARPHALTGGKWMTFWHEGTFTERDLYYQVFNADGSAAGTKALATTSTTGTQARTDIYDLPGGGFMLVWTGTGTQPGQEDADRGFFFQRFDAAGNKVGSETRINTTTVGESWSLDLEFLPTGHIVAVWTNYGAPQRQPSDEVDVFQQVFDADWNRVGPETRVATTSASVQNTAQIKVLADGSWIVGWEGHGTQPGNVDPYDDTTGTGGVFFQHFRLNEPPTAITLTGTIREDAAGGTIAGALTATDPDPNDTFTYAIVDNQGASIAHPLFEIVGGTMKLKAGASLDYEAAAAHTMRIKVTDAGGDTFIQNVTVTVTDAVDVFMGTAAGETISGTAGDDRIYGKLGKDVLTGSTGRDIFVFDTKPNKKTNLDTITDFSPADDTIGLDNKYFKKLGKGSEASPAKLNKKFFKVADKAKDKDDYLVYDKKKGILYYDADGSGAGKAVEIAKLAKNLKLTAADFFVV
ncbi:cadherin domain-containing protein [Microvirga subterranea]|uniref:Cadherin domain-containing protein n=1 Tax=Microvirga subterranea TaxID=186651 RepID=A0A370HSC1_9HYPH|nr:cadherin domain-containing protein [Microvirga subterranea]RDI59844.1 cadherin domain-containing protein [Microvirga subterranea]